jgi:hypothetical protein
MMAASWQTDNLAERTSWSNSCNTRLSPGPATTSSCRTGTSSDRSAATQTLSCYAPWQSASSLSLTRFALVRKKKVTKKILWSMWNVTFLQRVLLRCLSLRTTVSPVQYNPNLASLWCDVQKNSTCGECIVLIRSSHTGPQHTWAKDNLRPALWPGIDEEIFFTTADYWEGHSATEPPHTRRG